MQRSRATTQTHPWSTSPPHLALLFPLIPLLNHCFSIVFCIVLFVLPKLRSNESPVVFVLFRNHVYRIGMRNQQKPLVPERSMGTIRIIVYEVCTAVGGRGIVCPSRAVSSVGQSACFTRTRSLVRAQYRPPFLLQNRRHV